MQAAAFKGKEGGDADNDKDAQDPDYENVSLTFRNWEQPRDRQPDPVNQALPRPSSDTLQVPIWLHRAIMSLYVLLALTFLFFIILSVLIMLKNSEMSRELLSLKREFWNASHAAQECQEEQKNGWRTILQIFGEATKDIETKVQGGNEKLSEEVKQVSRSTQKILELLERKTSTCYT